MENYIEKQSRGSPQPQSFICEIYRSLQTICCLLSLTIVTSIAYAQNAVSSPIARMGDVDVPLSAVEMMIQSLPSETKKRILDSPEAFAKLVKTEALRRVVLRDAYKLGIDRQPNIAFQIERARDRVVFDQFLEQQGEPASDYPSSIEAKMFYESNKEKFKTFAAIRLAQIIVQGPMHWPRETRLEQLAKAKEAHSRILKGEDFAAIARQYSDDTKTNEKGGDLGWMPEVDVFPLIKLKTDNLSVNGVTQPIRTQFGWHIVKIIARRQAREMPFAEARSELITMMRKNQGNQLQEQYLTKIQQTLPYQADTNELDKLRERLLK